MDIFDSKHRNKSTIFILPLLYPELSYKDLMQDHFIMCFIADGAYNIPDNTLTIEYDRDLANFKIPEDKLKDYRLLINGNYSDISDKSKKDILSFWQENDDSYLYSVLYKTDKILTYWKKKFPELDINSMIEYYPRFHMSEETRGMGALEKMYKFKLNKEEDNDYTDIDNRTSGFID